MSDDAPVSMAQQQLNGARDLARRAVREVGRASTSPYGFAIEQLSNALFGLCDVVEAQQRDIEARIAAVAHLANARAPLNESQLLWVLAAVDAAEAHGADRISLKVADARALLDWACEGKRPPRRTV